MPSVSPLFVSMLVACTSQQDDLSGSSGFEAESGGAEVEDTATEDTGEAIGPFVPMAAVPPTVSTDRELLLEGDEFCAINPEFSPDQAWVYTMELADARAPIPVFDLVVWPFDRDRGELLTLADGTTPSARLRTSLYGRPYFAQDARGPYLVGDAVWDAEGTPMRTLTRWRPQLSGDRVILDEEALASPEPDHDPSMDPSDSGWAPCRRSLFPYSEPGDAGRSYLWWFESDRCASNQTTWLALYTLDLDDPMATPQQVERQAWTPACQASPACFFEWRGNLPMDISYARWVLNAAEAHLLYGSVTSPEAYGAPGASYGDAAGGGPIELKRLDLASGTVHPVTDDASLKIAPFAVSPERFVSGVDGAAMARSYAWSVDRFRPLHDIVADPTASGLYSAAPSDAWPAAPEGAASAEAFLVRGVAEYAAFQLTLGGTFAWTGLPGEIWVGASASGAPWPISDADRDTARNEPEPVLSKDLRTAHVIYSAWDVEDPALSCQQMRAVSLDFRCATLDVPAVADASVGPDATADRATRTQLPLSADGQTRAVLTFDLSRATAIPNRAELIVLPEQPDADRPVLMVCEPFDESDADSSIDCVPVDARSAREGDRWVFDATEPIIAAGADRVTFALGSSDAVIGSKEGGRAPLLRLAFDDCDD
ncbi:MAG: hypothetical protein AAFV53_16480 [Myxococcota bacterium]